MKKIFFGIIFILAVSLVVTAQTRLTPETVLPQGNLVYSLPATSIFIKVEATHSFYTAGPYAQFSQKYLGVPASEANKEQCVLNSVTVQPLVEADLSQAYAINLKSEKNAAANFLAFTAEGLIVSFDKSAQPVQWRFSNNTQPDIFADRGVEPNLATEKATFYSTVRTATGVERVPVQQNQTVEKSLERRAEEAANMIFKLRKQRVDLITGDADLPGNGDGLRAALDEIDRLESSYMSLFTGKTTSETQVMTFEVMPDAAQENQRYVAFRLSDTQGLLPPSNVAGRPIMLELTPEKHASSLPSNADDKSGKGLRIVYRIPEIVQARLTDGTKVLIQARIPVYQLGKMMSFPAELSVK